MKTRQRLASGVAALALVGGVGAPAFADISYPGGGTWSHGTRGNGTEVYSDYHHPSTTHRGSTINAWGEYSCDDASAGAWARDSQRAKPGSVDSAYWAKAACGG